MSYYEDSSYILYILLGCLFISIVGAIIYFVFGKKSITITWSTIPSYTTQVGATQSTATQSTATQPTTTQSTATQPTTTQSTATQPTTSLASQQIASQQMVSQQIVSQQIASQQMVSQQIVSQQMAIQQLPFQKLPGQQLPALQCYYIFNSQYLGLGTDSFRNVSYNVVTVRNLATGQFDANICFSGVSNYNMTPTSSSTNQLINYLPVNERNTSKGIYLGNLSGQVGYLSADKQSLLSDIKGQQVGFGSYIGNKNYLTITNSGITLTFWYMTGITVYGTILSLNGANNQIRIHDKQGSPDFALCIYNGNWYDRISILPNASNTNGWQFEPKGWVHYALTLDSSGTAKWYKNGQLVNTTAGCSYVDTNDKYSITAAYNAGFGGDTIGYLPWFGRPPQNISGTLGINNIGYYATVLSDDQIASIYNGTAY